MKSNHLEERLNCEVKMNKDMIRVFLIIIVLIGVTTPSISPKYSWIVGYATGIALSGLYIMR